MTNTGTTQPSDPSGGTSAESSPIVRTGVEWILHTALLFSVFVLFVGHRSPGGGFAGGLVAGIALVLRHLSSGRGAAQAAIRVSPTVVVGFGLTIAAGTGAVALVVGPPFLTSATLLAHLPLLGTVEASSALLFETGIYLIVVGVVLMLLQTVGREQESRQ